MYIDDPDWEGPRCRMCLAPLKEEEQQELGFCSGDCVRAKYIG
jgi:hypothetical protein